MMFDKKLYVETCSALHASEDTLAEVLKLTSQQKQKTKYLRRPAVAFSLILVLLASSAALAAGNQIRYSGWPHHASLQNVEKMGFHYPEQLGKYQLSPKPTSRMHIVPAESGGLAAWFQPDYTWMSLDYENEDKQSLSVSFGKMDDPLWAYCFSYDENTGIWTGAENPDECAFASMDCRSYIKNVTEHEYEGCTIYLADRITEYFDGNDADAIDSASMENVKKKSVERKILDKAQTHTRQQIEAHWTDSEIGLCFSISDAQDITQKEMLEYVTSIIDHNR